MYGLVLPYSKQCFDVRPRSPEYLQVSGCARHFYNAQATKQFYCSCTFKWPEENYKHCASQILFRQLREHYCTVYVMCIGPPVRSFAQNLFLQCCRLKRHPVHVVLLSPECRIVCSWIFQFLVFSVPSKLACLMNIAHSLCKFSTPRTF